MFERNAAPDSLAGGLQYTFRPNWLVLFLVRYLEGPIRYDELAMGSMVRKGLRLGFLTSKIWVDSMPSLNGGRQIWGVPKELAKFHWDGDTVRIEDQDGHLATLAVDQTDARSMKLPLLAPAFGIRNDELTFFMGRLSARMRRSSLRVCEWSDRLPSIRTTQFFGIDACPMEISVGAPKVVGAMPTLRSVEPTAAIAGTTKDLT